MQDLNMRPLGPEGPNADPHGVVPGHLESYPFDNTAVEGGAGSHTLAPLPPVATPFGALVVRGEVRQLLTVREVAARLRVSRATVYRLVQSGALPVLRVSNSIRVPEDALDRDLGYPPSPGLSRYDVEVSSALGRTPRSDHDVHVLAQADDELQEPVGGEAREAPPQ